MSAAHAVLTRRRPGAARSGHTDALAIRTEALNLDRCRFRPETLRLRSVTERTQNRSLFDLPCPIATSTDQELRPMQPLFVMVFAAMRTIDSMRTRNERAQALKPMHEAVFQKEIKRTIDRRRGGFRMRWPQLRQKIVSPRRLVTRENQAQNLPTRFSKSLPITDTPCSSVIQPRRDLGRE